MADVLDSIMSAEYDGSLQSPGVEQKQHNRVLTTINQQLYVAGCACMLCRRHISSPYCCGSMSMYGAKAEAWPLLTTFDCVTIMFTTVEVTCALSPPHQLTILLW
jgi:hypothetical protein